jgi:altronate hydrolase
MNCYISLQDEFTMTMSLVDKPSMIRLNGQDNVLVSTRIVEKGETTFEGVATRAKIMRGHKMASTAIADGTPIRKFGQIIGFAKGEIAAGD